MKTYDRFEPEVYELVPLRELLKERGISAGELCRRCKLKPGQVSKIANNPSKNINLSTLEQLMIGFGLTSFDQLIRKKR